MLSRCVRLLSLMPLLLSGCGGPNDEDQAAGTELRIFQREMQCVGDDFSEVYIGQGAVMTQPMWCGVDGGDACEEALPATVRDGVARVPGCSHDEYTLIIRYVRPVATTARQAGGK